MSQPVQKYRGEIHSFSIDRDRKEYKGEGVFDQGLGTHFVMKGPDVAGCLKLSIFVTLGH